MIVLGLHFGHDAAVCIVRDGVVASFVSRERRSRVKRAVGLTTAELELVFADAGITFEQVDYCAITSTQHVELVTGLIDDFAVSYTRHPADTVRSTKEEIDRREGADIERSLTRSLDRAFDGTDTSYAAQLYRRIFPEGERLARGGLATVGCLDVFVSRDSWRQPARLLDLAGRRARLDDAVRLGFHHPVTVTWRGVAKPGCFVQHHMAHAASTFYRSGYERAAILTHDGYGNGRSYHSGLIAYGDGNRIWAVSPHGLSIGGVYDRVAAEVGLGVAGGAGKLMGLAPYGKPAFFRQQFVGNDEDFAARFGTGPARAWIDHCRALAEAKGYDLSALGNTERTLDPINVDFASSTQRLFEETYLAAADVTETILRRSDLATGNLCLSGGTALNCPSNSKIFREGPFQNVFIEPSCDDSGLAIGGALYVTHNLFDRPRATAAQLASPYLGHLYSTEEVDAAIARAGERVRAVPCADAADAAGRDLAENQVIAWFEGGSENGPRALGHRSLLANPGFADNWARVNHIKGRELWRPFAPAVLEEDAADWFEGAPLPSPYMLFTAQVRGDRLPAITHVDGSARIQTVGAMNGEFRRVLESFRARSGLPVVMNTSLNGPGEPIVETPDEALAFLAATTADALYMGGYRIERA